jgi:quinol monooxygenase YgiN
MPRFALVPLLATLAFGLPTRADDHPVVASAKKALKNPDQPFAMTASLKVKAGQEAEFEAAYADMLKATRKEKADLYRDPDRAGVYLIHERWKDVAALADHLTAAHTAAVLKKFPGWVEAGSPGKFHTVVGE